MQDHHADIPSLDGKKPLSVTVLEESGVSVLSHATHLTTISMMTYFLIIDPSVPAAQSEPALLVVDPHECSSSCSRWCLR
jgi:hypothetical protein